MPYEEAPSGTLPLPNPQRKGHQLVESSGTQFWSDLYSIEVTSDECLAKVQTLLSSQSSINIIRSFEGNEAQTFIDFLDQVLGRSRLDEKPLRRGLRLLSKICKTCRLVPASYILRQVPAIGEAFYHNGSTDVSRGEYMGSSVAIKRFKMNERNYDGIFKNLCREIINWKHLSHPNVFPLLGICMSADPYCFLVLSEWMDNGSVVQYARSNPKVNRLQLLSDVMSGVVYLHELRIVHGDLKGVNILVDKTGTARIADFGLMTIANLSTNLLSETEVSGGTVRWMSPELLYPSRFGSNGRPTRESDCYALGMVIYEILTGLQPFHRLTFCEVVAVVLEGKRPERPLDAESLGFSYALWERVDLCWKESSSARPTAKQLLNCLSVASPNWAPPPVYPIDEIDAPGCADLDSSGSLGTSLGSSMGEA